MPWVSGFWQFLFHKFDRLSTDESSLNEAIHEPSAEDEQQSTGSRESNSSAMTRAVLFQHALFFVGSAMGVGDSLLDVRCALDAFQNGTDYQDMMPYQSVVFGLDTFTLLEVAYTSCYLMDFFIHVWTSEGGEPGERDVVFAFGLGAIFELIAATQGYDDIWSVLSVMAYFYCGFNAFFVSPIFRPSDGREFLYRLGDLLFLLGSMVDVAGVLMSDDTDSQWVKVASMGLVSSILWFADSIAYIAADMWYYSPDITETSSLNLIADDTSPESTRAGDAERNKDSHQSVSERPVHETV